MQILEFTCPNDFNSMQKKKVKLLMLSTLIQPTQYEEFLQTPLTLSYAQIYLKALCME